jgi:hypothetical protein
MQFRHLLAPALLATAPSLAHVADSGIDYTRYRDLNGAPCCDHTDCRPADAFVEERAHWCGGRLFTNSAMGWLPFVWCVILPPRES